MEIYNLKASKISDYKSFPPRVVLLGAQMKVQILSFLSKPSSGG